MAVTELLADLQRQGFILTPLPEGRLSVRPAARLTDALRAQLRQRKAELLAALTQQQAPRREAFSSPSDYHALYGQMARAIPANFHVVDAWLCDHHPTVWRQIREIDDELTRLEQQGVPEAAYQTKLDELLSLCREAKALREGRWGALLVKSTLLGCEVWVIRDEGAMTLVKDDSRPIFFADEIALLKGKAPEQIKDILKAKAVFPGCRVVQ